MAALWLGVLLRLGLPGSKVDYHGVSLYLATAVGDMVSAESADTYDVEGPGDYCGAAGRGSCVHGVPSGDGGRPLGALVLSLYVQKERAALAAVIVQNRRHSYLNSFMFCAS